MLLNSAKHYVLRFESILFVNENVAIAGKADSIVITFEVLLNKLVKLA